MLRSQRALHRHAEISGNRADACLELHLKTSFVRSYEPDDVREAWRLRELLSFTDAWYVAIAKRLDVSWYTSDQRAARSAEKHVDVRLVTAR